jgi:DNA-binding transcriptional regulator WhiA
MPKGVKISDELVELIIDNYNKGLSPYKMVKQIKELEGIRPSVIYDILKREDIPTKRKITLTEEQRKSRRKYDVDDNYFEVIDTAEKAYWLGFMLADGWVTKTEDKVGLSLAIKDKGHVEKFKECVKSESPINVYNGSGYNEETVYARIIITSPKMKKDLIDKGVYISKTDIVKFPFDEVPVEYHFDFIRGYYDGDGSITYGSEQVCGDKNYNIKFVGTKEFIEMLQYMFNLQHLRIEKRHGDRKANNWTLTIGGNLQVMSILDKLYNNSIVHLDRKYQRYLELKQQYSCRLG